MPSCFVAVIVAATRPIRSLTPWMISAVFLISFTSVVLSTTPSTPFSRISTMSLACSLLATWTMRFLPRRASRFSMGMIVQSSILSTTIFSAGTAAARSSSALLATSMNSTSTPGLRSPCFSTVLIRPNWRTVSLWPSGRTTASAPLSNAAMATCLL